MKGFSWLMDRQLEGLRALSHFVFGDPRADEDFERDLAEAERAEDRLGKETVRGSFLRLEQARRRFVASLFRGPEA